MTANTTCPRTYNISLLRTALIHATVITGVAFFGFSMPLVHALAAGVGVAVIGAGGTFAWDIIEERAMFDFAIS